MTEAEYQVRARVLVAGLTAVAVLALSCASPPSSNAAAQPQAEAATLADCPDRRLTVCWDAIEHDMADREVARLVGAPSDIRPDGESVIWFFGNWQRRDAGLDWPCTTGVIWFRAGRVTSISRPTCGLGGPEPATLRD